MKKIKLNIGAGITYIPGFINIDILPHADICLDLNKDRLPFEDNSVEVVFSYHTLEHIKEYLYALKEIYRVLKHKGKLFLGLPYVSSTRYHLVNPYHYNNFNEYSFDFFDPEKLLGSAGESPDIMFKIVFCEFHYVGIFKYLPSVLKNWCRHHLLNVVRKMDVGLLAIKDREDLPVITRALKKEMKKEFNFYLKARKRYAR
jgi:SAM-dependent methyltransferase